nr:hypothetical protein BaRGS_032123 [Batillaria attramentaria]
MFPRAGLDLGGAVYPMYQDMASRRRSFPHWDDRRAPPLDQMILCGMFYADTSNTHTYDTDSFTSSAKTQWRGKPNNIFCGELGHACNISHIVTRKLHQPEWCQT